MGQSYGGLLLTLLQAEHGLFEGVAMLGWSGICTQVKNSSGADNVAPPNALAAEDLDSGLRHPYRRSFHFDDVPEDIVAEDLHGHLPASACLCPPGALCICPAVRTVRQSAGR